MPRSPRIPKSLVHLTLALALVGTQAAGVGFCGGDLHDADSSRSHFHTGALVQQPAACGHCHHADDDGVVGWESPADDYDSDAVYVSVEADTNSKRVDPPTVLTAAGPVDGSPTYLTAA